VPSSIPNTGCTETYCGVKTEFVHAGDSQLSSALGAQNLPAADAESSQAWNQYNMVQQHGATDSTDGPQSGHTQHYGMSGQCLIVLL